MLSALHDVTRVDFKCKDTKNYRTDKNYFLPCLGFGVFLQSENVIIMTDLEKGGVEYCFADPEKIALKTEAIRQCEAFNAIDGRDYEAQYRHLQQMLGGVGQRVWIAKTFNCDRGKNIFIGDDFTGNHNLTILDIGEVHIGNHVMIGPHTLITTVGHPLEWQRRRESVGTVSPVVIEDDVWIGGNVTVLPGVTIGRGAVVAAGAVVAEDVPPCTVVGGVPAKIIKKIPSE